MKKKTLSTKGKAFRISAKRIYLTYSQVDGAMQSIDVLNALKGKTQFSFKHLISKEYHQDGGTHFHVLLEATRKFEIKKHDFLDITYQDKPFHGNYQAVKRVAHLVEYVCKAGDYITDFANIQKGKLLTAKEVLIQQVACLGVHNALLEHCEQAPNKALNSLSLTSAKAYFKALDELRQSTQADATHTPFALKDFDLGNNPELVRWKESPNKTLVLTGPSGSGKTQFCKAVAADKNLKALLVNHVEGFKHLNAMHDCIIIDDANMHELNETDFLSVIDSQQNKTLRVLYGTVNKKPGLIQMFTLNRPEFLKIQKLLKQERVARRVIFSELKGPIINLNVNIQINNVTNNYRELKLQEDLETQENIKRINLAASSFTLRH
jgi:nucleoside-triphosphatase THEP1